MSAEMLAILDAARALHERHPQTPGSCLTCRDEQWPCKTAMALGATGRSEWANGTQHSIKCGATGSDDPDDRWPCVLDDGHGGDHRDRDGDTIHVS